MRIAIRTDASRLTGTGHVMRCLTLANALRDAGAEISFICRRDEGHLCNLIVSQGFGVHELPAGPSESWTDMPTAHAVWLGTSWQTDAIHTAAALATEDGTLDWLVVDHYALDGRWETAMRAHAQHIMVIDDLADRSHDCDVLLDQNLVADLAHRYIGKVPATCHTLLGPAYALLQPDYREQRKTLIRKPKTIERVLIFFGGADPQRLTERAISAFLARGREDIEVDIVFPANAIDSAALRELCRSLPKLHFHSRLPSLAPLMARADLAIGAGGVATWERLCMGLPALVITLADNQFAIAAELDRRGLIRLLGEAGQVGIDQIGEALGKALEKEVDADLATRCMRTVDGLGTARVCAVLTVDAKTALCARPACAEDEDLLLSWANDPVTRKNSFDTRPIPAETHHSWFQGRLARRASSCIYIIETAATGVALGHVRFDQMPQGVWEIDYSLASIFRGRRLGQCLLETALQSFSATHPGAVLMGQVKAENTGSRRVFEAAGFDASESPECKTFRYRLTV